MTTINVPNSSVVVDNPRAVDQSTVVFPECGDAAAVASGNYPANTPSRTGKIWQPAPVLSGGKTSWGGAQSYPGPSVPKPGSFDPTPATANPVLMNVDPPVAGKGKPIVVTGSAGSTATDSDHNRKVVGQVPGTSIAFSNPS